MTDEILMEAVKNGNLQQSSLLFERYHKPIFNFIARMTMDRELAEDLTQNVFMRMIQYSSSYHEGNKFKSWIYQIARNVFIDHYHSQKNKRPRMMDVEMVRDSIADTEETAIQQERERLLHRSMNMLTDEQRELLVLTRFQRMKYEEVALIMNTTVANIKVKVHRVILKLKDHYFELEKN